MCLPKETMPIYNDQVGSGGSLFESVTYLCGLNCSDLKDKWRLWCRQECHLPCLFHIIYIILCKLLNLSERFLIRDSSFKINCEHMFQLRKRPKWVVQLWVLFLFLEHLVSFTVHWYTLWVASEYASTEWTYLLCKVKGFFALSFLLHECIISLNSWDRKCWQKCSNSNE